MISRLSRRRVALACALALSLALPALAAPPIPPQTLSYQAVLLDDQGMPRAGNVDVTLRLFDSASGGTLVYVQEFLAVPLNDGILAVSIGPTGKATDVPTNPLTTDLRDALVGDVGVTAPDRFLEVTVGSEGALSRTQVLTVPYAMHSETSDVAGVATTATNFGGLPGQVFEQLFDFGNTDGGPFLNSDPVEGIVDTDGDGVLNFADPDNDGDGIDDGAEASQGSNPNLVTPVIDQLSPDNFSIPPVPFQLSVDVTGSNFDPGLSVAFSGQTPTPLNLTPTSFEILVDAELGTFDVVVTNPNGETAQSPLTFTEPLSPAVHGVPAVGAQLSIDFTPGQILIGGDDAYGLNLFPPESFDSEGAMAVAFQPTGELAGVRCRVTGTDECTVELAVDSDADFELEDEVGIVIEVVSGPPASIGSPSLLFDPSGNPAVGYVRIDASPSVVVAHDRDGNGDFAGTNERIDVAPAGASATQHGRLAIDSAGRVAYVFRPDPATDDDIRVAWDRSGDGDFDDTVGGNPELFTAQTGSGSPSFGCVGAAFDASDRLAFVRGQGNVQLYRDKNGDGDFADTGERPFLSGTASGGCSASSVGGVLSVAHAANGFGLTVLRDLNDDGDFGDAGEDEVLEPGVTVSGLVLTFRDDDTPIAADATRFFD
ncbi:MAG: hypothetical protein QNK05_17560 [Myxococcota bacterium]|nr:hypothetical protein [Myxococcota bacterium]